MIGGSNREIALFFGKVFGVFVIWYLFYELWLLPDGRLDEFLSVNIVGVSAGILSVAGFDVFQTFRTLGIDGTPGLMIVDGCNGLEAIGLFIGFVVAYPGSMVKRILFIPAGILAIYLLNIFRIVTLTVLQSWAPQFFDFAHDYSTSAIFYLAIFGMWVIWANYGGEPEPQVPSGAVPAAG